MDQRPLVGHTVTISSRAPAAALSGFLLAELGARVRHADEVGTIRDHAAGGWGGVTLSGYGERGACADAPAHVSAIHAIGGAALAQYTFAPGPAYLVTPYATVAQAIMAAIAAVGQRLTSSTTAQSLSALQSLLAIQTGAYAYGAQQDANRFGHTPRGQMPTYSCNLAADGWLFIGASTRVFMIKVLQLLGLDDVLSDPRTHEGPRGIIGTEIDAALWQRIPAIIRTRARAAWLQLFEEAGVPAGPILTLEQALRHPQIAAAGLASPGEPLGTLTDPVRVSRQGDAPPRLAEALGPLPLSGTRVVELAGYIAGPYVGRLLADMGADVVKIEPPDGDPFRTLGYGFTAWNWGKSGLALDLRDHGGRERLLRLVQEADIVVTNYRPDALARMGVGRDMLFRVNPALIHCTVSAFGESGPMAHLPGFDPVVQGFTGVMARQGGDGEPVKPQMAATDYLAGMLGALGVVAARYGQLERGGGAVVQTSLLAASLLLNSDAYDALRAGRRYLTGGVDFKGPHPLNGLHRTRDGWLQTVLPDGDAATPLREARAYLDDGLLTDDTTTAMARLTALGLPTVRCIDPEELPRHPHFTENRLWITVEQPELGPVTLPAPVLGPVATVGHAPRVGEHNALDMIWHDERSASPLPTRTAGTAASASPPAEQL